MNTSQAGSKDISKQLEYVKQQQQLRALGSIRKTSSSKTISADSMIEDLLSKKETFQKRNQDTQQKQQEVPGWLSGPVHPLYERVWQGVQEAGGLAHTPRLSSLLMSSGLSTDTLGYIWALANRTVPGYLTQQELYLVLALVGLAQTGYVVNNLAALHQLRQAPVPTLDLSLLPTRAPVPHVYPNPLNVTSLPDPLNFNWVSTDTAYPSSSEKIGISYVSSGPMVSPKLISNLEQTSITSNLNSTNLDPKDYIHEQKKHSSNTYSFSFPSLNESPSHIAGVKPEDADSFDDEFTDFQSADFSSVTMSEGVISQPNFAIDDEDEFTNFQKASPKYDSDDLSVLVVGGRSIPSAQQLWVADSPSANNEQFNDIEIDKNRISDDPKPLVKEDHDHATNLGVHNKDRSENKYDVFQELEDDKYSIFHNPLPDDEDKQSVNSNVIESVPIETKSIFQHPLFDDPEPPVDFFSTSHQGTTFDALASGKFGSNFLQNDLTKDDDDDDEFSNFQNFPVAFPETNDGVTADKSDKYDVFRTIVFEESSYKNDTTKTEDIGDQVQEDFSANVQLFEAEMDILPNNMLSMDSNHKGGGYDLFSNTAGKQNVDDIKFGDFQESVVLPSSKNSNIDSLFSSLAISDKNNETEVKQDDSLILGQTEDRYKALRLLESTNEEMDDFGEFLGADLPNSGNEPQKSSQQASVQVRCLEACLNLLKAGLTTLSNVTSSDVISEVLSDSRANTYLDCLLEIHRVSERIICNMDSTSCAPLAAELRHVWEDLAPYFTHTEHNHLTETVGAVCGVCRSNTGPSTVTFGALSFHSPCANLYLHCVEPVLPNVPAPLVQ